MIILRSLIALTRVSEKNLNLKTKLRFDLKVKLKLANNLD